ncbi:hypothetical protein B0H13DRAFT_1911492 [Mycena leptocephala]|nr:hypothetical protein B0H13DRAFT_1911492 [Mycena leptocephala]
MSAEQHACASGKKRQRALSPALFPVHSCNESIFGAHFQWTATDNLQVWTQAPPQSENTNEFSNELPTALDKGVGKSPISNLGNCVGIVKPLQDGPHINIGFQTHGIAIFEPRRPGCLASECSKAEKEDGQGLVEKVFSIVQKVHWKDESRSAAWVKHKISANALRKSLGTMPPQADTKVSRLKKPVTQKPKIGKQIASSLGFGRRQKLNAPARSIYIPSKSVKKWLS